MSILSLNFTIRGRKKGKSEVFSEFEGGDIVIVRSNRETESWFIDVSGERR